MAITLGKPSYPTDGIVLHLDAGNASSYPGTGTTWTDLSGNSYNYTVLASAWSSSFGGYFNFGTSSSCAVKASDVSLTGGAGGNVTLVTWTRVLNSSTDWRTLVRGNTIGADHQIIIQSGGWNIGMYDNANGSGFNDTGYSQQSLPGYSNSSWVMMAWRFYNTGSSHYHLSVNNAPSVTVGSIASANSMFKSGIGSIGAYHGGNLSSPTTSKSQFWGDIAVISGYNKILTDDELLQYYNAFVDRFGLDTSAGGTAIIYPDSTVQASSLTSNNKGALIDVTSYTTSGSFTWTKPSGTTKVYVRVVGGGGGGAGYCESGGAGGYAEGFVDVSGVSSVSVTVGAGSAAVAYYTTAGTAGGTSSFGSYLSATGGGCADTYSAHSGGFGGLGSGGAINVRGGAGVGHHNSCGHYPGGRGGGSYFGGSAAFIRNHTNLGNLGIQRTSQGAPGSGGPGQITDGGGYNNTGAPGEIGAVIVYSYK
jgi:hypothetical protein